MSLTRVRWLAAVWLSLGISPLCQAQEVWRPVARSAPPATIAVAAAPAPAPAAPPSSAAPAVIIGKPIAIASSAPPLPPRVPAPVVVRAAAPGRPVIRGQSPDLDSGSPFPPPFPPDPAAAPLPPGGASAEGPYTTQDAARFNTPALAGVTIPQLEMAPTPTSGDPVYATAAVVAPPPAPHPVTIPTVSVGQPRGQETRTVSATVVADGPVDPPPPTASVGPGTAPPQPAGSYSPYAVSTSNQPESVAPPGVVPPPADLSPGVATDRSVAPGFWENCRNLFSLGDRGHSNGRCAFQSDHSFDALSSPVTMPFYAEDPRSLTEAKPIFIYQKIPGNAGNFGGGSATFFGTQARLALTERLSVVMSELGYLSLNPKNTVDPARSGAGISEIKIGPKYTFLRNTETGTVAAGGVNFELPVGGSKNFQDTGSMSLDPYLSFAQTFGRLPGGFGSLNFMDTTGYSLSLDRTRSEFFYTQLHLDYNVANANKLFPLVELNYLHYTSSGRRGDFGTEGADLINLGSSTRRGKDYVSLAGGVRYRFTENIQAGAALEVPVTRERGLADYRLTFDVIFRY